MLRSSEGWRIAILAMCVLCACSVVENEPVPESRGRARPSRCFAATSSRCSRRQCSYTACHGIASAALRVYSPGKLRATAPVRHRRGDRAADRGRASRELRVGGRLQLRRHARSTTTGCCASRCPRAKAATSTRAARSSADGGDPQYVAIRAWLVGQRSVQVMRMLARDRVVLAAAIAHAFPTGEQFDLDALDEDGAGGIAFDGAPRFAGHTCAVCHTGARQAGSARASNPITSSCSPTAGSPSSSTTCASCSRTHMRPLAVSGQRATTAALQRRAVQAVRRERLRARDRRRRRQTASASSPPFVGQRVRDRHGAARCRRPRARRRHRGHAQRRAPRRRSLGLLLDRTGRRRGRAHRVSRRSSTATAATARWQFPDRHDRRRRRVGRGAAARARCCRAGSADAAAARRRGERGVGARADRARARRVRGAGASRSRSLLALATRGCVHVRPRQRETLAQRNMKFAPDPTEDELDLHMQEAREGSSGGYGS